MLTMAIEPEIEKRMEDLEDVHMAERVLAEPGRRYTLEEVEQELGLAD
jgi:hypothetical protein